MYKKTILSIEYWGLKMSCRYIAYDRLDASEENELILSQIEWDLKIVEASYDIDLSECHSILESIQEKVEKLLNRAHNHNDLKLQKVKF
jgi:hypothetical protein